MQQLAIGFVYSAGCITEVRGVNAGDSFRLVLTLTVQIAVVVRTSLKDKSKGISCFSPRNSV
jgi:hypothetical protein